MNENELLQQEVIVQENKNTIAPSFEDTGWDVNSIIEMAQQADNVTKAL